MRNLFLMLFLLYVNNILSAQETYRCLLEKSENMYYSTDYCLLTLFQDKTYEIALETSTEDMIFRTLISFGTYSQTSDTSLVLSDLYNCIRMEFNKYKGKLVQEKGFTFLTKKTFDKSYFLDNKISSKKDSVYQDIHFYLDTVRHTKKNHLKYGVFVNDLYELMIGENKTYRLTFDKVKLCEGSWSLDENIIKFKDGNSGIILYGFLGENYIELRAFPEMVRF